MSTPAIQQYAGHYIRNMRFDVVRVRPRTKEAMGDDWNGRPSARVEDFHHNDNIGLRSINGIIVSDCDAPEAVALADKFLTRTGAIWGRDSAPRSKRAYMCGDLEKPITFRDLCIAAVKKKPDGNQAEETDQRKRGMIVELRIDHQDVIPPSIHPSGERYRWSGLLTAPTDIEADNIIREHQLLATAVMAARYYNPPGNRHDWAAALAGLLRGLGVTQEEATKIIEEAGEYATDLHVRDRLGYVRSTYEKADDEALTGGPTLINLMGDHGKNLVKTIKKIWRSSATDSDSVVMRGGDLSKIVDRAQAALLADSSNTIYQRSGLLVRPIQLDKETKDGGVKQEAGSTVLIPVELDWLVERMGQTLKWFRISAQEEEVRADPKPVYARTLLGRREWPFPVLRAVLTAPTLARDGRIIQEPGYDLETGLLLRFTPGSFPRVPDSPTKEDAFGALKRLYWPLRGFPFVFEGNPGEPERWKRSPSASVAMAAMLTALVRASMQTSPLFAIDAPTAGTGKSLLAEAVGLLATGVNPAALSQGKTPEEDEKRLAAALLRGALVIHIDNCDQAVGGDFLCTMVTQSKVSVRILGHSELRDVTCITVVFASGNNLIFVGDATRRAVICRMDARVERPDTRSFDFDCHQEIRDTRPDLVVAGLTILRAYTLATDKPKLEPMGSFNDFEWIRGALVWLGMQDPARTRQSIFDNDPRRDELSSVMEAWNETIGGASVEVKEINTAKNAELVRLLSQNVGRGEWNPKSVGRWLLRNKDRTVGKFTFREDRVSASRTRWQLMDASRPAFLDRYGREGVPIWD